MLAQRAPMRVTHPARPYTRCMPALPAVSGPSRRRAPRVARAGDGDSLEGYIEVKVDSVRLSQGAAVVYLRLLDGSGYLIPVHVGEAESNALLKEINRQRPSRPLTHDLCRSIVSAVGYRVTKIRITDIVANTYYARVHLGRAPPAPSGGATGAASSAATTADTAASDATAAASDAPSVPLPGPEEVDVDARPSDAINLAVRFGAKMYVARRIADAAATPPLEPYRETAAGEASARAESNAEIVRSVREALASYDDPTVMYQLQKELAIKEERFEDARTFHESIVHEMTHNRVLRMVVAMETALADGRYDEAARLRDEYRRALLEEALHPQSSQNASGGSGSGGSEQR